MSDARVSLRRDPGINRAFELHVRGQVWVEARRRVLNNTLNPRRV